MEQQVSVIGGSFAPRITADKVAEYRVIAETVTDREIQSHMVSLCEMMATWLQTPDVSMQSVGPFGQPIAKLPKEEIDRIWDTVPWPNECKMIGECFEKLTDTAQRNAAFHLLWYAVELANDRQPCTKDLLPADMQ